MGHPSEDRVTTRQPIRVGHDCAGIEAPLHALDLCKVSYRHVFSSEINEHALSYIRANTQPETLYRDITERNVQDTPHVNLYIAGFPCQSYSRLNQKQKEEDPRKQVVDSVL